ncbi:hypothetical protein [Delftia acidovorans]|uniref:hypothetical protein n=1 Tax=Delftia acidovorans TaxID=80866 RepID=UPI0028A5D399|nr:hypothetical protein [Delftia acidovorans]
MADKDTQSYALRYAELLEKYVSDSLLILTDSQQGMIREAAGILLRLAAENEALGRSSHTLFKERNNARDAVYRYRKEIESLQLALERVPAGWRTVIDNHCDRLLDAEPSSYDSQGYRDFARSVLDGVVDELAALEADPATKRQEAEAIKAEFLERTGQYLTNDASREACIAEAVAAEREAAAPYVGDAIRYRLLRRGQHWSVIDWKGDVLRGDELDLAIDSKNEAKAAAKECS